MPGVTVTPWAIVAIKDVRFASTCEEEMGVFDASEIRCRPVGEMPVELYASAIFVVPLSHTSAALVSATFGFMQLTYVIT